MTFFPIHIIELITFALILVFFYRIGKELTLHGTEGMAEFTQVNLPHKEAFNQAETQAFPSKEISRINNSDQKNTISKRLCNESKKTKDIENQVLLKNYIGDFF